MNHQRDPVGNSTVSVCSGFFVKGSLHYNRSTANLVATWQVIATRPQSPVHNPLSRSLDHTHTQTSIVVHLIAQYSHCLLQHLRLILGKYTVLSPTLCGGSHVGRLRRFLHERAPLSSNSRGSPCYPPVHVWVSHSDPYHR